MLGEGSHVPSDVDGLDVLGQDIFDNPPHTSSSHATPNYSLPSPGGPMLTQHNVGHNYRGPGSVGSHPSESPAHHSMHASPAAASVPPSPHPMPSPASVLPPSPAQHQFQAPSPAQPPSPATYLPMKSPVNLPPPPSPANIYYSTKSPAAHPPQSPQNIRSSTTTPGPPILSPQPVATSVSQNSVFLTASPGGSVISGASILPGTMLTGNHQLGMQPLHLHPNGTIVSGHPSGTIVSGHPSGTIVSGGQVFQIQLQSTVSVPGSATTSTTSRQQIHPSVIANLNKGKQPQLLPKPSNSVSQQAGSRMTTSLVSQPATNLTMTSSAQQPIFINQGGIISNVQPGSTPIIMGQMMAQPGGQTAGPMIIQQPSGQMLVLRPNAPSLQTTPTIVPIAAAQTGLAAGQFILQQGQPRGIPVNQQVKLVQQNQMHMQQIQTPTGPKLIALPIGQTLIPGQNIITTPSSGALQITPGSMVNTSQQAGQIQVQTAGYLPPTSQQHQGFTLQATSQPSNIVTNMPLGFKSTSVLHQASGGTVTTQLVPSISQDTSQTPGNSACNVIAGHSVIQTIKPDPAALSPTKKKKSKKKRKDMEDESPSPAVSTVSKSGTVDLGALMKDVGLDLDDLDSYSMDQIETSTQNIDNNFHGVSQLNTSHDSISSSESQSTADLVMSGIQTNVVAQLPVTSQQYLNSSQLSLSQASRPVIQSVSQAPRISVAPQQVVAPQLGGGSSFQLIQGPDGQFILQSSATAPPTPLEPVMPVSTAAPEIQPAATLTPPRPPPPARIISRPRNLGDPNRTPLMEDDTLPPGWHRKVSQRKSGASAGRYEVFIIGPTSKRFRSRNELKSFFEKTGETKLNPDDFDFSTFGRNNPKVRLYSFDIK